MWKTTQALKARNARLSAMRYIEESESSDAELDFDKNAAQSGVEKIVDGALTAASTVDVIIDGKKDPGSKKRKVARANRLAVANKDMLVAKEKRECDEDWDAESIYAPSSDDDMAIETQKILKFPLKRTVRGVQKGQRLGRASRLACYPMARCWDIAGFGEFVQWVAKFRSDYEMTQNNNISSVRTFMQMFEDSKAPLSMRLLTSPDQIVKYMELIKAQPDYVPKTRLQKIEALKKAIKWLKSRSYMVDSPYAGGADRDNLDHILVMMNKECNDLRPYAKADEGRCSLLSSHIAKNAYLSMDNFAGLGRSLLEQLDKRHNNIADFKAMALRPDVIKNATYAYMKTLITSFFVLLPTQRAKLITYMDIGDISFNQEGASWSVTMEKNSYRRLGIADAVGRHIYIHPSLSQYLRLWTQRYRRYLVADEAITTMWIDLKGKELTSNLLSGIVGSVCKKLSGANLTPLSIRRLRTTYFVRGVQQAENSSIASDLVAQYAAEVNQTPDIIYKYYVIKNPEDQVAASRKVADLSNQLIFGTEKLLAMDKLQAYKPRYTVSVEVAKKRARHVVKELPELEYVEGAAGDNISKDKNTGNCIGLGADKSESESNCKGKGKVKVAKGKKTLAKMQKSISGFFAGTKPVSEPRADAGHKQTIVDLTIEDSGWEHDHNIVPCIRQFRLSFSDRMRQRIANRQWLSDEEMSGAMGLLRRQFPKIGGLENTLVLMHSPLVQKALQCDNIYIVCESNAHWVCAKYTCRRNVFMLYDSLQGTVVSRNVQMQLEKVGRCGAEFSMQSMQRQQGSDDCGLFAIAVAVDLAHGVDPGRAMYRQGLMRRHLIKCFDQQVMTIFPRLD
jgi:hypothetical protein